MPLLVRPNTYLPRTPRLHTHGGAQGCLVILKKKERRGVRGGAIREKLGLRDWGPVSRDRLRRTIKRSNKPRTVLGRQEVGTRDPGVCASCFPPSQPSPPPKKTHAFREDVQEHPLGH